MIDYASVIDGALAWLWDNKLVLAGWIIALIAFVAPTVGDYHGNRTRTLRMDSLFVKETLSARDE